MDRIKLLMPMKLYVVLGDYAAEAEMVDMVELNGKFRAGFVVSWNNENYASVPKAGSAMLSALQERYLPITNMSIAGYNMWDRLRILVRGMYFKLKELFPSEVRRNPDLFQLPQTPEDMAVHEHMVAILKNPDSCLRCGPTDMSTRKRTYDKVQSTRLPVTLHDLTPYMTILTHHFKTTDVSEMLMAIRDYPPADLQALTGADPAHVASVYKRLGK